MYFINQFDGYQNTLSQSNSLSSLINILDVCVFIVCLIMSYSIFNVSVKNNIAYWKTLRTVGLSRLGMAKNMLIESSLFTFFALIIGYFLGFSLSSIFCKIYNTNYTIYFLSLANIILSVILGLILSFVPIFISLSKNKNIINAGEIPKIKIIRIFRKKVNKKREGHFIGLCIWGILLVVLILITVLFHPDNASMNLFVAMGYYFSLFIIASIITFFFALYFILTFIKIGKNINFGVITKLSSVTTKMNFKQILTVALALFFCFEFILTFINFCYSFTSWAGGNIAKEQMIFDGRATYMNTQDSIDQSNKLLPNIEMKNEYYLSRGRMKGSPIFIMQEKDTKDNLNEVYDCPKFSTLGKNEIAVSRIFATTHFLKKGDSIELSLNNQQKKAKIGYFFDTVDYFYSLIIMSSQSNLFNTDSYSNLCINFNLKNKNLNDLKSNKDYDSLTFESNKN